jgi:hypothetical protein
MRLHQPARNRQPKAAAPWPRRLAGRRAEKRQEDLAERILRDTRAAVRDLDLQLVSGGADGDSNRRPVRCVLDGVLDQVGDHLIDLHVVELHRRQMLGHVQHQCVRRRNTTQAAGHFVQQRAEVVPALLRADAAGFDARKIKQIADEPVQAVGLVDDGPGELPALRLCPLHVLLKGGCPPRR